MAGEDILVRNDRQTLHKVGADQTKQLRVKPSFIPPPFLKGFPNAAALRGRNDQQLKIDGLWEILHYKLSALKHNFSLSTSFTLDYMLPINRLMPTDYYRRNRKTSCSVSLVVFGNPQAQSIIHQQRLVFPNSG
ncbi:hypothetical protein CEXT_283451 [Caerostris extrusa]|uniref:Uncharacterized protein n=1 Tax=Caerostris extrusa TaxID=172846 RepID=A0AAV4VXH9_CAEEX|nr:hypothetical protein CEXT_283451 [Caerostris extrusa]